MNIQGQEVGQQCIAAMTKFDRFQACVKTPLLFIEQAVEEQNGGLELLGQNLQSSDIGHNRNRLRCSPRQILLATSGTIDRRVQVPAVDFAPLKAALFGQLTQRVLHFDMQSVGKITGKETLRRAVDEGFHGRQQRAIAGKPNRLMRPETLGVKTRDLGESVVTAAMGITGQIAERLQLAENGKANIGAKSMFQLGKSRDFVAQQILPQKLGIESSGPHNVTIPTRLLLECRYYNITWSGESFLRSHETACILGVNDVTKELTSAAQKAAILI